MPNPVNTSKKAVINVPQSENATERNRCAVLVCALC